MLALHIAIMLGIVVNTVLLIAVLWKKEVNHAEVMDLLRLNMEVAQSARINRKEATIQAGSVVAKMEENVGRLERVVPEKTAEKVVERIKEGDSGIFPQNGGGHI